MKRKTIITAPVVFIAFVIVLIMLACSGCSANPTDDDKWHEGSGPGWNREISDEEYSYLFRKALNTTYFEVSESKIYPALRKSLKRNLYAWKPIDEDKYRRLSYDPVDKRYYEFTIDRGWLKERKK